MTKTVDNVVFVNPSVGTLLTVYLTKSSADVNTATTKYLDLPTGVRKVQIRSAKIFRVIGTNGQNFTDPSTSGTTAPEFHLDLSGTGAHVFSIQFEPDEASGEFQVLGIAGCDGGNV